MVQRKGDLELELDQCFDQDLDLSLQDFHVGTNDTHHLPDCPSNSIPGAKESGKVLELEGSPLEDAMHKCGISLRPDDASLIPKPLVIQKLPQTSNSDLNFLSTAHKFTRQMQRKVRFDKSHPPPPLPECSTSKFRLSRHGNSLTPSAIQGTRQLLHSKFNVLPTSRKDEQLKRNLRFDLDRPLPPLPEGRTLTRTKDDDVGDSLKGRGFTAPAENRQHDQSQQIVDVLRRPNRNMRGSNISPSGLPPIPEHPQFVAELADSGSEQPLRTFFLQSDCYENSAELPVHDSGVFRGPGVVEDGSGNNGSLADQEKIYLRGTPYTQVCPRFRHGPIRINKANYMKQKVHMENEAARDWVSFQVAILGTGHSVSDFTNDEDIKLSDDIAAWLVSFGSKHAIIPKSNVKSSTHIAEENLPHEVPRMNVPLSIFNKRIEYST